MGISKEPVRLRRRRNKSGLTSLYLDIYIDGHRSYEYLKMYLVPEKTRKDKEANKQTLLLADAIRAKRVVELRNGQYGFKQTTAPQTLFFDYYKKLADDQNVGGGRSTWRSCYFHMQKYEKKQNITFAEITPAWIEGFKRYLDKEAVVWANDRRRRVENKPLAANTKANYFNKLKTCINKAFDEHIIPENPIRGISGFKGEETERVYLTLEEVRKLAETKCDYPTVKTTFLFSCLTGLRRSDISKLTWGEVREEGSFTRIVFKQKKTKGLEYLDISPQAAELMGERGESDEYVFPDIYVPSVTNNALRIWSERAGIKKRFSFHSGRHTFATLMLNLGTDIYTVSKLLGHRNISTTQIYAKVLDKNKQAAVSAIPSIFK